MKIKKPNYKRLDMVKCENETDWKTAVTDEINHIKSSHRKTSQKRGISAEYELEFGGALEKRRVKVLLDSLPSVQEKHPKSVSDWITLNISSESYAMIEDNNNLLLAAALWILDQIEKTDTPSKELYKLLPTSEEDFDDAILPDIWDCKYEQKLIYSVESVLRHRNRDLPSPEDKGCERFLTSSLAAAGKAKGDVPSRRAFEKLINLVPYESRYVAVQHFKLLYEQWKERFFVCIEPLFDESERIRVRMNTIRDKLNKVNEQAERMIKTLSQKAKKDRRKAPNALMAPLAAPVNDFPKDLGFAKPGASLELPAAPDEEEIAALIDRMDALDEEHDNAIREYNDIMKKKYTFSVSLNRQGYFPRAQCEQTYGKAVSKHMDILPINDPYELCFALLYLIEQDSDIPWLYGSCTGFMEEVVCCLPWGFYQYEEYEDDIWLEHEIKGTSKNRFEKRK